MKLIRTSLNVSSSISVMVKTLLALPLAAFAGTTWDGGGTDDSWGTAGNWNPDGAPPVGSTVDLTFDGNTRLNSVNNYGAFDDFRSLVFASGAGSFNITGSAIDLFGKIENSSANTQTVNLTIGTGPVTGGFIEINPVAGNLNVGGTDVFLGNNQLRVWGNNGKTLTFGAGTIISGSGGSLAINQNSDVVFQSAHTYTGGTFVNAGKLSFAAGGSANGGTLNILDTSGAANAAVDLAALAGGQTISSAITIRSGSTGSAALNSLNTSGTNTLSGGLTLNKDLTITTTAGGTLALPVGTNGAGALILNGGGTVAMTSSSGFSGGTTVNGGTLTLNAGNSARPTGTGTLTINAGATVIAVSGTGGSGHNQFGNYNTGTTVPIVINGGTLTPSEFNHMNSLTMTGGTITVGGSAGGEGLDFNTSASVAPQITTLASATSATIDARLNLRVALTLSVADGAAASDLTITGTINAGGGIIKTGAGTATLSGDNTYGGSTTISGGVLSTPTIANGGANSGIGASSELATNLILNGGTLQYTGATATTNRAITANAVAGNGLDVSDPAATLNLPGNLTGAGGFTKFGAGTLNLSGNNNTLAGGVTVSAGVLTLTGSNNGNTTAGGSLTVNAGAVARAMTHNAFGQVTGAVLSTLTINGGTFEAAEYNHINSITMTGGTLGSRTGITQVDGMDMRTRSAVNPTITVNAFPTTALISSKVTLNGPTTISVADGAAATDLSMTGAIGGGSSLTKTGAGTLSLDTTNGFTGGLIIDGGRVIANGDGSRIGIGSSVTINNTGVFQLEGTNPIPTAANSINPTINAGGTLLVNSGNHAHLGNVTLNGGSLLGTSGKGSYNGEDFQLNGNVTVGGSSASTINLPNGLGMVGARTFNVADVTNSSAADLTLTSAGAAILQDNDAGNSSLIKTGDGTMVLNTPVSYTGGTTVNAGVLQLNSTLLASSNLTVNSGGRVDVNATNNLFNGLNVTLNSGTLQFIGGGHNHFNGALTLNGGSITTTAGSLPYDNGNFAIDSTTVTVGGSSQSLISANTGVQLNGSPNFVVADATGSSASDLLITANLRDKDGGGARGFTKSGLGTMELTGISTYTGPTNVTQGKLLVNGTIGNSVLTVDAGATLGGVATLGGNVVINGLLSPGNSPGTITLNNTNLSFGSGSTALFELGGTSRGNGIGNYDSVIGVNLLTIDGVWSVELVNGFSPALNDSFDLFDASSVDSSGFVAGSDLVLPSLSGGLSWDKSTFTANGVITVVPEPSSLLFGAVLAVAGLRRRRTV